MNADINIDNRLLCILIIVLAIINLRKIFLEGKIISAVGGLHINILIFYGVGPLTNTYAQLHWDYVVAPNIMYYANTILWYVALCYLGYTVGVFLFMQNKNNSRSSTLANSNVGDLNKFNTKVLIISFLGYLLSRTELALSGIGTIFPVCKNLLFPCLIMLIYNFRKSNSVSVVLLFLGFVLVGINAFFSAWRSELIMFIFSVGIGLVLKSRKLLMYGLFLGPILVVLILPFQYLKKTGKIKQEDNFVEAFVASFSADNVDHSDISLTFFSYRLNYVRESAYVLRGIDKEYIDYRYGETYLETFLQLVPRAVWPEKPSFNYLTNRVIPRQIGLVNKLDKYTSWGVNYFAEFMYNFPIWAFPFFFLFYFILLGTLDRIASRMRLTVEGFLLLKFALFFQVLSTVSITFASTYFLWIFIIIKLLDNFKFNRQRAKLSNA